MFKRFVFIFCADINKQFVKLWLFVALVLFKQMSRLVAYNAFNAVVTDSNYSVKANAAVNTADCRKSQITLVSNVCNNETYFVHMRIKTHRLFR